MYSVNVAWRLALELPVKDAKDELNAYNHTKIIATDHSLFGSESPDCSKSMQFIYDVKVIVSV